MYQSHMLVLEGCSGRHGDSVSSSSLHTSRSTLISGESRLNVSDKLSCFHCTDGVGWEMAPISGRVQTGGPLPWKKNPDGLSL